MIQTGKRHPPHLSHDLIDLAGTALDEGWPQPVLHNVHAPENSGTGEQGVGILVELGILRDVVEHLASSSAYDAQ